MAAGVTFWLSSTRPIMCVMYVSLVSQLNEITSQIVYISNLASPSSPVAYLGVGVKRSNGLTYRYSERRNRSCVVVSSSNKPK